MHYTAFGLALQSAFALIAMDEAVASDDLPTLALTLQPPEQLRAAWQGARGAPEWTGRLGDGEDLVIERGPGGDRLFSYGHRAQLRLHADMRTLDCGPLDAEEPDWQRALITKVIPAISVMRGYEALHACALQSPDGVVGIIGPSGAGKSTLAAELARRGWPLFADDILTLEHTTPRPRAHPGTRHMNLAAHAPGDPDELGDTIAILAGERWMRAHSLAAGPMPVRMLCLLDRRGDSLPQARVESANPLVLAPYMLGLSSDSERQRSRFDLYADLMESATLVRLTAAPSHSPEMLADMIELALARRPQIVVGGIG